MGEGFNSSPFPTFLYCLRRPLGAQPLVYAHFKSHINVKEDKRTSYFLSSMAKKSKIHFYPSSLFKLFLRFFILVSFKDKPMICNAYLCEKKLSKINC